MKKTHREHGHGKVGGCLLASLDSYHEAIGTKIVGNSSNDVLLGQRDLFFFWNFDYFFLFFTSSGIF